MKPATRLSLALCALSSVAILATAADKVVNTLIVPDGASGDVISGDGIETTARVSPLNDYRVHIQAGGDAIFWARTRIILRDGFKATAGYTTIYVDGQPTQSARGMVVAIDSDGDGYSDMEEVMDSDGDGMCDAWEIDHLLVGSPNGGASSDPDGDGLTNWEEYQRGLNPNDRSDGPLTFPGSSNFRIILKTPPELTPSYFGVDRNSWTLSTTSP